MTPKHGTGSLKFSSSRFAARFWMLVSIFFHLWNIFYLFVERKIIPISSIGNFKNSGCPFKNCYSYISCTEMRSTILSVVRVVASRSTNVPVYRNLNEVKAQALSRTGNPYSFSILYWKLKIPKANNHFFLVFNFMHYSTFCVFDWHI